MKFLKSTLLTTALMGALLAPFFASADDKPKPIPYTLKTCIVSGDKLGGDMGDPYVYIYNDKKTGVAHEIKFCCKSCLKDFNKDPQGYIQKIDDAEAKAKKK
jgi:hypothetical protein